MLLVNAGSYMSPTPQLYWEIDIILHGKHTIKKYER